MTCFLFFFKNRGFSCVRLPVACSRDRDRGAFGIWCLREARTLILAPNDVAVSCDVPRTGHSELVFLAHGRTNEGETDGSIVLRACEPREQLELRVSWYFSAAQVALMHQARRFWIFFEKRQNWPFFISNFTPHHSSWDGIWVL